VFQESVKSNDDWVEWGGGECPVPPDTWIQIRFRDGGTITSEAGLWEDCWWENNDLGSDIVKYRVTNPKLVDFSQKKYICGGMINPYYKEYPYDTIDIYRVLQIYEVTDPCIQHAVKKLLCAGKRGYKEVEKDVEEAIMSLQRWGEMRREES
jgi:hypothetical protein